MDQDLAAVRVPERRGAMAGGLMRGGLERRHPGPAAVVRLRHAAEGADVSNRGASDSLDAVFGIGPFRHQLVLRLASLAGVLDPIARAVADGGAVLQTLNICELDSGFSAKIWIKGVSCDAARRLSDRLADMAPVSYAHVEHHLGRAPQL